MEAGVISVCRTLRKPLAGEPVLQSQVHFPAPQPKKSIRLFTCLKPMLRASCDWKIWSLV